MKLVAWNIRHGGGNHRDLATALSAHDADVFVLGEHRTQKTALLIDHLRLFGWSHVAASSTDGEDNGVAVVSRMPVEVRPSPFGESPFCAWGVEVVVNNITVIGIYAPLERSWRSSPQIQREFWARVLRVAEIRRHECAVLLGDFNTCGPQDGPSRLPCADALDRLVLAGWADGWRACNPDQSDYSYVQRQRSGTSNWRIDHAFVSAALIGAVKACRYSHAERAAGLSDHSILQVELR
jgi:exonuclease III